MVQYSIAFKRVCKKVTDVPPREVSKREVSKGNTVKKLAWELKVFTRFFAELEGSFNLCRNIIDSGLELLKWEFYLHVFFFYQVNGVSVNLDLKKY